MAKHHGECAEWSHYADKEIGCTCGGGAAESLERERDMLAAIATKNKELAEQEHARAEKLQADLDAALDVARGVSTELKLLALGHPFRKETAENWAKNLDALLEKRREQRG